MSSSDIKQNNEEFEDAEIDYDDLMDDERAGTLFFSMTVDASNEAPLEQPAIEGFILHITNACFGPRVQKGSRTVVVCKIDEKDVPVCVLTQGNHENHSLDLLFNEGATFELRGTKTSSVTLTGYCQPNIIPGSDLDPELEEQINEAEMREYMRRAAESEDVVAPQLVNEDEEDEEDITVATKLSPPPSKKRKTTPKKAKKAKKSKKESSSPDSNKSNSNSDSSPKAKSKSKKSKAKATPTPKKTTPKTTPKAVSKSNGGGAEATESGKKKKSKKNKNKKDKSMQSMKGGIQWRDMKEGKGQSAVNGKRVSLFYVGQLDDNVVFDKCITGEGFSFVLGEGKVIKGWEMGIKGMKVGTKRKLIIPAKLGYGKTGSLPKIPPNSKLTFTVEMKSIS